MAMPRRHPAAFQLAPARSGAGVAVDPVRGAGRCSQALLAGGLVPSPPGAMFESTAVFKADRQDVSERPHGREKNELWWQTV